MKVLFLNSKNTKCGVYQYGRRLIEILYNKTPDIQFIYLEIDTLHEYHKALGTNCNDYVRIVYNYHPSVMPWLNSTTIQRQVKNIGIIHEYLTDFFDIYYHVDPTIIERENHFYITRPIFENIENHYNLSNILQTTAETLETNEFITKYTDANIPIFGSFGFGDNKKGFDKIVKMVNEQYDEAIIKFVMTIPHYNQGEEFIVNVKNKCFNENIKPGIILMITHTFFSNDDILRFLNSNTINIFLYDLLPENSVSSVIDYALSVSKPIGISDSNMFKHIYSDKICLYKTSIKDCIANENYLDKFREEYSNKNLVNKFLKNMNLQGIFYNSKQSRCSIWESGYMCYNALKNSDIYRLDYSETEYIDNKYDFLVVNQHPHVNSWITKEMIDRFHKPNFCIVTEVSFGNNSTAIIPQYFKHYIVLDPSIKDAYNIHGFGRPLEDFDISNNPPIEKDIPTIFGFGICTPGKEWDKIVELVQNDYDYADIHFNLIKGDWVTDDLHNVFFTDVNTKCNNALYKSGVKLKITSDFLTKEELIKICSIKSLNCFPYKRTNTHALTGLAATTDQAISAGRPILVTSDVTFRHTFKYVDHYPNIGIKQAIEQTQEGVLKMKEDWSSKNFLLKFEKILFSTHKIHNNFDWQKYVNDYADLKHINNEADALHHWLNFGKFEGRII